MTTVNPIHTGTALAVTVGIGYAACTLVFWLWPETAAYFMNALFHGLDFSKLQSGSTAFYFSSFLYVLVALVAWAFVLGVIYGWVLGRLGNGR